MKLQRWLWLPVIGLLACLSPAVWADSPDLMNYQGKLTDAQGNLIGGSNSVSFSFFTAPAGGESVWTEVHDSVEVTQGLFSVVLGSVNTGTLGQVFRDYSDLYLELAVNEISLIPRQQMASVGFAFRTSGITLENGRIKDSAGWVMPPGTVVSYAGPTAPDGWLICDGSAVSRSTYPDLFSAIGTAYGSGDGTNTFNLPDMQGNVAVGLKSGDEDFNVLGGAGGTKTHALTTSEIPAHNHGSAGGTGTINFHGSGSATVLQSAGGICSLGNQRTSYHTNAASGGANSYDGLNINTAHTHSSVGGGAAHNNLQPYRVMNFIIKY